MLSWSTRYETGNQRIDLEHQMFFHLIKNLSLAREADEPREHLERIMEEIVLYAKFHFKSEENYMQKIAYPHFDAHKAQHRDYVDEFVVKVNQFHLNRTSARDVEDAMVHWLVTHLGGEDHKITAFAGSAPRSTAV